MNRNDFNKNFFLYSIGLSLTPSLINCSMNTNRANKNNNSVLNTGFHLGGISQLVKEYILSNIYVFLFKPNLEFS